MSSGTELAQLYRRDITKVIQELEAFPDDETLWRILPGISNSAGNLVLHLEGNLREYIGRQLGHVPFGRQRDLEFSQSGIPRIELIRRMSEVKELIPEILSSLSDADLEAAYPEVMFGATRSVRQYLWHTHGHLNFHLGQIDYLRRILTSGAAIQFASL
jgi:hypothetical protein